jgi:hypothetical protein
MRAVMLTIALAAALVVPTSAAGDPGNTNTVTVTLTCSDATYTGVSIEQNNALPFQIVGETFVAISQEISYVDGDGNLVVVRQNPGIEHGHDLVPCTYTYPGFPYLVTGQFLFTGNSR